MYLCVSICFYKYLYYVLAYLCVLHISLCICLFCICSPLSKWRSKGSLFERKITQKPPNKNQSRCLKILRKKSGKWSCRGSLDMRSVRAGAHGSHVSRFLKKTTKVRKKAPKWLPKGGRGRTMGRLSVNFSGFESQRRKKKEKTLTANSG